MKTKNLTKKLNDLSKKVKENPTKIPFSIRHHTKKIFKEHVNVLMKGARLGNNVCVINLYSYDMTSDEKFNYSYYLQLLTDSGLEYTVKNVNNILSPDLDDDIEIIIKWGNNESNE